jgi:gamma-glutamyltranspeptidase/glutathione hydrolase
MLQVFLNIFHFGMDIQQVIDAPRITSHSFPSSFAPFRHFPAVVSLEDRIDEAVRQELERRGHRLGHPPGSGKAAGDGVTVPRTRIPFME